MTRLYHAGAETGADHAEGLTLVGTTLTYDTGTKRTGTRSWKFDSSAANTLSFTFTGATSRRYFSCCYIRFPAASGLPGTSSRVLQFQTAAAGVLVSAQLTTTGKLQLLDQAGTQIGVDSSVTLVADTWYRVELAVEIGTGSIDYAGLILDGEPLAATNVGGFSDSAPGILVFGWIDDPGTSEVLFVDDLSLNDNQGSANTSWVGASAVYLLLPTSDNADGGWTAGGGGTSLFDGIDNTPPTGAASPGTNASQIGNAVSSTTDNADVNLASYTTAGVASGDTVAAAYVLVEGANSSTTGTDTLRISLVSNPAIAETSPIIDILAGTYPSGWNRLTSAISENPTVTRGTQPVLRVGKNIANVRRANVCFAGLYVGAITPIGTPAAYSSWTPANLGTPSRAWYRAEDVATTDGAAIVNWTDFSGNAHTGTAPIPARDPFYFKDGANHMGRVFFSHDDDMLTDLSATSNDETIYIVTSHAGSGQRSMLGTSVVNGKFLKIAGTEVMRYVHSTVAELTIGTTTTPTTTSILGGTISSTTAGIYHVNGVDQTFTHSNTFSGAGTYYIGANLSAEFVFASSIYEIVITPALGTTDRQKVEGYLAHKYAITAVLPGGHPYKSSPPTTSTARRRFTIMIG